MAANRHRLINKSRRARRVSTSSFHCFELVELQTFLKHFSCIGSKRELHSPLLQRERYLKE
jgi:hypothetical protein